MRAAVLPGPDERLQIAELPEPTPGQGEVVIAVDACGICGSDLHAIRQFAEPGTVMGHEFAGEIAAVGAGVDRWEEGQRVTARPMYGCGSCNECTGGRPDRCQQAQLIGHLRPGGWAEQVVVPAAELFAVPDSIGRDEAALIEPLAIARRALRRAGDVTGEHLLILGGGPVGLAIATWAGALEAAGVVISEPDPGRRALAESMGFTAVDPGAGAPSVAVLDASGHLPTAVFECVGRPGLIQEAMNAAGNEARVVVVGVCPDADQLLPYVGMVKELDVRFAIYYESRDWTETIAALDEHRLAADDLITEVIGLDELPDRFAEMVQHASGGKVVVDPTGRA